MSSLTNKQPNNFQSINKCSLPYFSCSDGAGRSGTYIAISNLVDRVKAVQVIDVFQCIKLIRCQRPQFVETVVSDNEKPFKFLAPLKKQAVSFPTAHIKNGILKKASRSVFFHLSCTVQSMRSN